MYRKFIGLMLGLLLAGCATLPAEIISETPPQPMPLHPAAVKKQPVIGIALGGGNTRGFAHIGVLNTLEENGIVPDIVVGTSAGAVTGALFAGGIRGAQLKEAAIQLQRDQIVDWSYSGRGFIRGDLLQNYIDTLLENRPIEQLPTVFAATATDLVKGTLAVFTKGDTGLAVRASSAIPGLVSPVTINGRDYVDGGLVSKVPVQVARQLGADIVIAVDVSRHIDDHLTLDSTSAVLQQAFVIMSQAILEKDLQDADVVIRPDIGIVPIGDFDLKVNAISAGENATIAVIPAIQALLRQRLNSTNNAPDTRKNILIPVLP